MRVSRYAVKHPVVIGIILIALIAFGIFCFVNLSLEFVPDMSLPEVQIFTVYPGASAELVAKEVTSVLEDELIILPNISDIKSESYNSFSWITISYQNGIDAYDQMTELRFKIDEIASKLPESAEKPYTLIGGSSMLPIVQFVVIGGEDTTRITNYINDTLKPKLTKIAGVTSVYLSGDLQETVNIKLRMDDVLSKNVSVLQIYQALQYSNYSVPLGTNVYQEHLIETKFDGSIESLDKLASLPIGVGSDNIPVKLSDVADVTYSVSDPDNYVIIDGNNQIMVSVVKRSEANTSKIVKEVKKVLEDLNKDTNGALTYKIVFDQSNTINKSLKNVLQSGIVGLVVAIAIVLLFLNNPWTTLIIGSSIPLSFLFSFIAMKVTGQTINLITMSAMVVSLGMVVDASIVMLEEIAKHIGKKELQTDDAIIKGANEVGPSIVASALTTMIVFVPMYFLSGIMGMIIKSFALVIILCIFASLLVSIIFVPFLIKTIMGKHRITPNKTKFMHFIDWTESRYRSGLSWSLKHPLYSLFVPILLLALSAMMVLSLGFSFIPTADEGDFYVNLKFPQGYTLEENKEKSLEAAAIIESIVPEKDGITTFVGQRDTIGVDFASQTDNSYILVTLKSGNRRKVQTIINEVQHELSAKMPDCSPTVTNGGYDRLINYISGGGGYKMVLVGNNLMDLYEQALKIQKVIEEDPSVKTTNINVDFGSQLLSLEINQDSINSLGITTYEAGMISAILFNGVDVGRMTPSEEKRSSIHLSSDINKNQINTQTLGRLPITTLSGKVVSLSDLGDFEISSTVSSVSHYNRSLSVSISATLISEDASGVNKRVNDYLENNPLPEGIDQIASGIVGLIKDSIKTLIIALVISVFLVYIIMVIQFEKFHQPIIIMISIPFCMIGVIVSLILFKSNLTLMSVTGIITLAGTVVNSAIILVDWINQTRNRKRAAIILKVEESLIDHPEGAYKSADYADKTLDYDTEKTILFESIIHGGASRLRPILITTLTTIIGVIPMAFARSEGSELYASIGQAIAGGLFTSTLITLFVIPVVYYLSESRILRRNLK